MKPIVVMKSDCSGDVARVVKHCRGSYIGWIELKVPVSIDGQVCRFRAAEETFNVTEGRVEVIREQFFSEKAKAEEVANLYLAEYEAAKARMRELLRQHEEARKALLSAKPAANCTSIKGVDLEDYDKAGDLVLRSVYPKVFECFDRIRQSTTPEEKAIAEKDLQSAYILDCTSLVGAPPDDLSPSNLVLQIAAAMKNFERGSKKAQETATLKREIVRGWFKDGYATMTHHGRAEAINQALGTAYKVDAVRKTVRALGLDGKVREGRPEKNVENSDS